MNVAVDCPECCTPPEPIVLSAFKSKARAKVGWNEYAGQESNPPEIYTVGTLSGGMDSSYTDPGDTRDDSSAYSGAISVDKETGTITNTTAATLPIGSAYTRCTVTPFYITPLVGYPSPDTVVSLCARAYFNAMLSGGICVRDPFGYYPSGPLNLDATATNGEASWPSAYPRGGSVSLTLSNPFTFDELMAFIAADMAAADYSAYVVATPTASLTVSSDRKVANVEASRYKIAHPVPEVGNGKCYRVEWVKRFIPAITRDTVYPYNANGGGTAITSIEILNRGVYRPNLYIEGDGIDAYAIAVMSADGQVASIRLVNPGSNYTEAPTVTIEGDATATAVIDSDTESPNYGQVIAINVTAGGDYLPELTFSDPVVGGTIAEASVTLDETGGIATVTLDDAGEYYETVALWISAPITQLDAVFFVHHGEETALCYKWDGVVPGGYDKEVLTTYPQSAVFEFPVPAEPGEVSFAIKRVLSDCSNCP